MNYNMYAIERIVHDMNAERLNEAKRYRLWQKARKQVAKRGK